MYFSYDWIRLCPKKAITTCASTTAARQPTTGSPVSADSANDPLTLLTANHPTPAISDIRAAGRALPRWPNAALLSTICGTPRSGPREDSTACTAEPRRFPTAIARHARQKPRPKPDTASTPMKTVVNSRFGEAHVQNSWCARPCRSGSETGSTPPGSTATSRSP